MHKIWYIHGGFGNGVLQLAYLLRHERSFKMSPFFTKKWVRRLLGFTDHPSYFEEKFDVQRAGVLGLMFLPILFADLLIAKFFKHSLVTVFDTRYVRSSPVLFKFAYFGYFQKNIDLTHLACSRQLVRKQTKITQRSTQKQEEVLVHVRGGDFKGTNSELNSTYYADAIAFLQSQVEFSDPQFLVITNDEGYAIRMLEEARLDMTRVKFSSGDLEEDFDLLHNCRYLVTSKSTFALCSALTNPEGKTVVLPSASFTFKGQSGVKLFFI